MLCFDVNRIKRSGATQKKNVSIKEHAMNLELAKLSASGGCS